MREALLAAALLLAGCNAVATHTPLLSPEAGVLKPGVWRADIKPHCAVDESRPIHDWPDCAVGVTIDAIGAGRASGQDPDGNTLALRLVAGDPMLIELTPESGQPAEAGPYTLYIAGRVTRSDRERRAIEASLWLVQCGPPESGGNLTKQPFPGLSVDRESNSCTTSDPQALRAAALASETLIGQDDRLKIRWLRDGAR
jgi:hypothetical protein